MPPDSLSTANAMPPYGVSGPTAALRRPAGAPLDANYAASTYHCPFQPFEFYTTHLLHKRFTASSKQRNDVKT